MLNGKEAKKIKRNPDTLVQAIMKLAEQEIQKGTVGNGLYCFQAAGLMRVGACGLTPDEDKQHALYSRAADLGYGKARVCLGYSLLMSSSPEKQATGIEELKEALIQGNKLAAVVLANAYQDGLGVQKNATIAEKYQRLAECTDEEQRNKFLSSVFIEKTFGECLHKKD